MVGSLSEDDDRTVDAVGRAADLDRAHELAGLALRTHFGEVRALGADRDCDGLAANVVEVEVDGGSVCCVVHSIPLFVVAVAEQ